MENLKKFIFEKLLFSKVLDFDKPGIIYSKVSHKYSHQKIKRRIVFYFEEIIVGLQKETYSKLGEKASLLWYKIGKEFGITYMDFSQIDKFSQKDMVSFISYFFKFFRSGGCSCIEDISYSAKKGIFYFKGRDSVICRKTKKGDFYAGVCSGILSFLLNKNYESFADCWNCPEECKIISKPCIKKSKIDVNSLKNLKRIRKDTNFNLISKSNLGDFLRFKKLKISDSGKWTLYNQTIIPSPHSLFDIVVKNYLDFGLEEILKIGLSNSSEKFAKKISSEIKNLPINLDLLMKFGSAMGWGEFECKKERNKITLYIFNPATNEKGFLYMLYSLQGYLNYLEGKKYELKSFSLEKDLSKLIAYFVA